MKKYSILSNEKASSKSIIHSAFFIYFSANAFSGSHVYLEKITADDYRNYINHCKDKGFVIDPDESGSSYSAYNDDGFKLVIDYSDYNNMLSRYADFSQKIDSYNTDEMSAADAAYFLEVTSRIDQKLINASLS